MEASQLIKLQLQKPSAIFLLYIVMPACLFMSIANATSYDHVSASTATDYRMYQNLGTHGPDATGLNISNISEYSQTLLVTSDVNGAFQYPGQKSLSVFYVLNPYALNEVANAMQPSSNTVLTQANMPPSAAWSIINISYSGPSNMITYSYPLVVYATGYTNNSISYGGFAPYEVTYSNIIRSNSGTLIIPELYNITNIYLDRPIIGSVNISVWDVSYNNPSNAVKLADLISIPGGLILYGPVSAYQDYYPVDPANVPVQYDNSGYSSVNFTLTQTYNSSPGDVNAAQQFYSYSINTMVSNAIEPATFAFGIVNSSVGTWGGIGPMAINYTASSSNTAGTSNSISYIPSGGTAESVQEGFSNPPGSNVTGINPTYLSFNLAEINSTYLNPRSAALVAKPSSANVFSRILLNATVEYGKAPYTYKYTVFNAISGSVVASGSATNQTASNTFVWVPASAGAFYSNVVVTDANSNSASSPHTDNISVYPYSQMSASISASPSISAIHHEITVKANVSGGAAPYSYDFKVFNSSSGTLVASGQYNGLYQSTADFLWDSNASGTFYANVAITDSSSNIVDSAHSSGILVDDLATPLLTASSTAVDAGKSTALTATVSGGTPPYTYNFIIISNPFTNATMAAYKSTSSSTQNTFTWQIPGSYPHTPAYVKVTVTDNLGVAVNSILFPSLQITNVIAINGNPTGLSMTPSGNTIYVINGASVNAINSTTYASLGSFPLDTSSGLAFSPSGTTAYGDNYYGGQIYVFNMTTMSETNTIYIGSRPNSLALSPSGNRLYVSDTANNVSVINTTTDKVAATIPGFYSPSGIAISSSGATLYVANGGNGTISVVNTSTYAIANTINLPSAGSQPSGITFNPSGTMLYVANYGYGSVSIIDPSTDTVATTIGGMYQPDGVVFNPAGTFAYVTNPGSGIYVIDTATDSVVGYLGVTSGGFGSMSNMVFNPAGTAFIIDKAAGKLKVIAPLPYLVIDARPNLHLSPATTSVSPGQSIAFTNTVIGGVPPYNGYKYTVSEYGNYVAGAANTVIYGNKITFYSTGTYTVQEQAIDSDGNTGYSQNVIITANTATTTTSGNPGGNPGPGASGSGGGGGGGGGAPVSVIQFSTNAIDNGGAVTFDNHTITTNFTGNVVIYGYHLYNQTQYDTHTVTMGGKTVTVTINFITPTTAGISINGVAYTLSVGQLMAINDPMYVELKSISYLPIEQTVDIDLFAMSKYSYASSTSTAQTSAATSVTTIPVSTVAVQKVATTVPYAARSSGDIAWPYILGSALLIAIAFIVYELEMRKHHPWSHRTLGIKLPAKKPQHEINQPKSGWDQQRHNGQDDGTPPH
jgi:YVTN family beta-propeller protein